MKTILSKYQQAAEWISNLRVSNYNVVPDGIQSSLTTSNHSVSPVDAASQLETRAQIPLTDYMSGTLDVLYYGYLGFGTPPQSLSVDIDTGSADLWVSCRNLGFSCSY